MCYWVKIVTLMDKNSMHATWLIGWPWPEYVWMDVSGWPASSYIACTLYVTTATQCFEHGCACGKDLTRFYLFFFDFLNQFIESKRASGKLIDVLLILVAYIHLLNVLGGCTRRNIHRQSCHF